MLSFESSLKSFTDICEVSCTAHQMFICVKITEKATGRVITYCDPDDIYYPFETQSGQISSVGYAEVCAVADEEAVRKAGVAPQSRDAVLDIQQLCGIYSSVGCGKAVLGALLDIGQQHLPVEWLDEVIPDPADAERLEQHPERYEFGFILEDHII